MGNREANGNQEHNGKKERTISVKSVIVVILLGVVGYICGFGVTTLGYELSDRGISLPEILPMLWHTIYPYLVALCIVSCIVFVIFLIRRYVEIRRLVAQAGEEDEELLDEIEKKSSQAGVLYSTAGVCLLLFMSFSVYNLELQIREDTGIAPTDLIPTFIYLLCMLCSFIIYKRLVDMEMQRNPTRKGDILSLFFLRQWESTSDEAQKKILYEAGYRAFTVCTHVAIICDCVAIVCMGLLHTGLFPCLLIFAIILAGQYTFTRVQFRLEQEGWKE